MSGKSPAFQFYAAEWLADENVAIMSLEEEGAYIRLLSYCWREGSIPANPELLSRLCKGALTTVIGVVITCFKQHPDDPMRLIHGRLEIERAKQGEWKRKSSEGGKRGADARWGGENKGVVKSKHDQTVTTPITTPKQVVTPFDGSSSSSSSSSSNKEQLLSSRGKRDKREPDERHTPFKNAVESYWDAKNPDVRMTWDASEAKNLSLLLKANPHLQLDAFVGLLRNRFRSDVNHSERPRQWLDKITNYAGGPLNEFKNPKGTGTSGNTNKSQQRWNGNAASLQEFTAAREVDCGGVSEAGGSAPGSGEPRGPGDLFGPSDPVPHGGHPGSMRHALPDETQ